MDLSEDEKLQANAVAYLIEGQEIEEAALLLSSKLKIHRYRDEYGEDCLSIEIIGSRAVYEIISDSENSKTIAIASSLKAALDTGEYFSKIYATASFPELGLNWRSQLIDAIQNRPALNQGIIFKGSDETAIYEWEGLRFRSPIEQIMAKILDQFNVLFLPNCMARLGQLGKRTKREADFLICYEGKWGILEIDGEAYHTSAARDHDRDRLFRQHGIKVCEHYEAKRCLKEAQEVVKEFLILLKRNG